MTQASHASFGELIRACASLFKKNGKLLGGIILIYGVLFFVFASGGSTFDIDKIRANLEETLQVEPESIGGRLVLASAVLQASSSFQDSAAGGMFFISVLTSLALIWALRHIWSKKKTTIKDAYYKSAQPAIPFILLVARGVVQLVPLAVGVFILSLGLNNDTFISAIEIIGAILVLLILPTIWTARMLLNTVMALIIVTIPDMTPSQAYDQAKQLVKKHRAYFFRQIVGLILVWLILAAVILLGSIALLPAIAPVMGLLVSITILPISLVFIYTLYRKVL